LDNYGTQRNDVMCQDSKRLFAWALTPLKMG